MQSTMNKVSFRSVEKQFEYISVLVINVFSKVDKNDDLFKVFL